MTDEEFKNAVAQLVAEGGWSSIYSLVDSIPIEDLKNMYPGLLDDE
jgi:hypothetical protein